MLILLKISKSPPSPPKVAFAACAQHQCPSLVYGVSGEEKGKIAQLSAWLASALLNPFSPIFKLPSPAKSQISTH